jgi:type IV secretory pathway VirB9-like protein
MKRCLALILIYSVCTITSAGQETDTTTGKVNHITTALNHLTVLEFQEPVTLAAAGSADFQIERQDNKVFVKPLKSGASTDLFVWTASRRFSYELEPAGKVIYGHQRPAR